MGTWISIKNSKPPTGESVLVYGKVKLHAEQKLMFVDVLLDNETFLSAHKLLLVSHWMPLPDAPE